MREIEIWRWPISDSFDSRTRPTDKKTGQPMTKWRFHMASLIRWPMPKPLQLIFYVWQPTVWRVPLHWTIHARTIRSDPLTPERHKQGNWRTKIKPKLSGIVVQSLEFNLRNSCLSAGWISSLWAWFSPSAVPVPLQTVTDPKTDLAILWPSCSFWWKKSTKLYCADKFPNVNCVPHVAHLIFLFSSIHSPQIRGNLRRKGLLLSEN